MKAVILAAGAGARLAPLTAEMPKCVLPVNGRALLDRQLDALAAVGVTDVTVVAGHLADRVVEHVAGRCRVVRNDRYASTNSIVSLHVAADLVRGDAFLFQNADVLYGPAILTRLLWSPHANACLVDPLRPHVEGEYHVELRQGRIVRYGRDVPHTRSVGESGQLVKIGERDSAPFFDRIGQIIRAGGEQEFPNRAYDVLMSGDGLWPVYTAGLPWWEIDTPTDYERCRDALAASRRRRRHGRWVSWPGRSCDARGCRPAIASSPARCSVATGTPRGRAGTSAPSAPAGSRWTPSTCSSTDRAC